MFKKSLTILIFNCALVAAVFAQQNNTNTRTTRQTTTTTTTTKASTPPPGTAKTQGTTSESEPATSFPGQRTRRAQPARSSSSSSSSSRTGQRVATASDPASRAVLAAFNSLLDGIRRADVDAVMAAYWNSPQLNIFNNNGTVTKTWEQVRANRASSYPNLKDVKLDVRDVRVQLLGRDAALVTCLWTQSQAYRDAPETATGRLTLVFRRLGDAWKVIHTHTSPDAPDPSRLLPSEQAEPAPKAPADPR